MPSGYEVQMYRDIGRIAKAQERIADLDELGLLYAMDQLEVDVLEKEAREKQIDRLRKRLWGHSLTAVS